jgi:hypothetical protein
MPPTWEKGSVVRTVQHTFTNARIRDINAHGISKLAVPTMKMLKETVPSLKKAKDLDLQKAFLHMTERLQKADLTINFKADRWFSNPNPYDSYTQMYERAVKAGVMKLDNSDPKNPANLRVLADDLATFPQNMVETKKQGFEMQSSKVVAPKGAAPGRGLAPGGRGMGDVASKMTPGKLSQQGTDFLATNDQFDPKTRQLFAAVNYGRRPHGACTDYGHSFMVLSDKYKADALYFAGDTFNTLAATQSKVNAEDQLSYDMLGGAYIKASPTLRADLITSCLNDGSLGDTSNKDLLFEAHLFTQLKFAGGVTTLFISARDKVGGNPLTAAQWQNIQTNARAWAQRTGARLIFIE